MWSRTCQGRDGSGTEPLGCHKYDGGLILIMRCVSLVLMGIGPGIIVREAKSANTSEVN
jgi:hypothetical protein